MTEVETLKARNAALEAAMKAVYETIEFYEKKPLPPLGIPSNDRTRGQKDVARDLRDVLAIHPV